MEKRTLARRVSRLFDQLDGGDQERLVIPREVNLVTDLGTDQSSRQRSREGNAARGRLALVMPDQFEGVGLSLAHEGDPHSKCDSVAIDKWGKLGTGQPLAPISGVAQHRLALLFRQWPLQQ